MMHRCRPAWAGVVALCTVLTGASTSRALAQTNTGELSGIVRDVQGTPLAGARIVALEPRSALELEQATDARGRYQLSSMPVGQYRVRVELDGFHRVTRDVVVSLGASLLLDFTLQVGAVADEIRVFASVPLLQTTNAEISDVIANREVMQLPLNGRNFIALAQLSDGVVIPPGGTRGDALQQAGPLPNIGGQRSGHNIYLLDGFKVTDELFNNLVINPSVESIQEFKIQKSQYPAEFGGKASALINVATRAGANVFNAAAFEFLRDEALDARNYFDRRDRPRLPLRQHQFGGAAGGPIVRNRMFFFGALERQQTRRSLTRTFTVPGAAVRSGDFSGAAPLCDPLATGNGPCIPFSGNRIPADRLDPVALALLAYVPLPNVDGPVQNLASNAEQTRSATQLSARVDHQFGVSDRLFARLSLFDAGDLQPFGTSALQEALLPGFGRRLDTRSWNGGVSQTHVIGTAAFNELRVGWLDVSGGQESLNQGVDVATRAGLRGVSVDPRDAGFPQISTRGLYTTFGDPTSFVSRRNRHLEIYENLTLNRGAHRLKTGGYFFHLRFNPEQPDNARGAFTYSGQFSGNAFADFLLGYPSSAVSGIGRGDENGRTNWLHLFAQDDWRVRSNLTLNLGLRYEYNQHMRAVDNRLSSVDLSVPGGRFVVASDRDGQFADAAEALLPLVPLPWVTSAAAGWERGLLSPSRVRLAPRTGFALSLADDRAVLRGGYGIFLNQWAYSVQTAFARNLPFFFTRQVDVPSTTRVPTYPTATILTADPTTAVSPTIMDYDYRVEFTQTWSGGVQYQLRPSTLLELSYMGSWTTGADNATLRNVPEPGPGAIQARRPIPALGLVRAIRFDGRSIYHGLTARLDHPMRSGLSYGASYTLSTSKDDASSPGATESETNVPQNVRNVFGPGGEWAPSSFDHRHQMVASVGYELPGAGSSGRLAALLGGWRVNAVFLAQAGAPFTVNLGVDQANIGSGPAQRPDQQREPNLPRRERSAAQWFDTSAFTLPAPFTFGTAPRNSVLGPGFASLDLLLARTLRIGPTQVELRWEVFNALNRVNLDLPNRTFGTPSFGRVFSAKSPREMQVGAKLRF